MIEPMIKIPIANQPIDELISKEWLVTNGLGGYASGTILGINTRRYHGYLIPNLPSPRGRTMIFPYLAENFIVNGKNINLGGNEFNGGRLDLPVLDCFKEFRLDWQTPTWIFEMDGNILEKKIFMPYGNNTVGVFYRLLSGDNAQLKLRIYGACRGHDSSLGYPQEWPFKVTVLGQHYEISPFEGAPILRVMLKPNGGSFVAEEHILKDLFYRIELRRGLDCIETLRSPGYFSVELKNNESICFLASTEIWEDLEDDPHMLFDNEINRRKKLISLPKNIPDNLLVSQLILAADQFIILPRTRYQKNLLLDDSIAKVRTVIAGYHWFTDWGRDTMISLEGLTLCTGRHDEARAILQTFGHYVRNGLLPNHFFEGARDAIYNTVDATLWYFHALDRYLTITQDRTILESLYPTLQSIIEYHMKGTDFGIHMDPVDNLISAAAEGFQLTWMDAKVDEWVVTPRRGKPVEIQALWYNALRLMEEWSNSLNKSDLMYGELAEKVFKSFNARFWFEGGGYLYDVIDTSRGADASLRPNQIFAVSLRFAVLNKDLWKSVLDMVETKLLTPYGLRTLDPKDKDYHGYYQGNRWERDAAYHQGLVWTWLIGPFMDAWQKVYLDQQKAQAFFKPFEKHLTEAGVGTISEIFDGDDPYHPRACIAQAWSVAEVLRCLLRLQSTNI